MFEALLQTGPQENLLIQRIESKEDHGQLAAELNVNSKAREADNYSAAALHCLGANVDLLPH